MRKIIAAILIFGLFAPAAWAVALPDFIGMVNDFAGVLTTDEKSELEAMLTKFKNETSNEFVIVIVPSFEGLDSFTYSQQLFTKWKIGQEGKNNGLLFLWGPTIGLPFPQRGEVFVNIGGGLEGVLPDALVGAILGSEVYPNFKNGKYIDGLRGGMNAFIAASKNEYTPSKNPGYYPRKQKAIESGLPMLFVVIIVLVICGIVGYYMRKYKLRRWWWAFGVVFAIVGVMLVFLYSAPTFENIFWSGVAFGIFGLIAGFFFVKAETSGKSSGGGSTWFGSGGSSGGGFGGFGGGSSRGGGAGGRY